MTSLATVRPPAIAPAPRVRSRLTVGIVCPDPLLEELLVVGLTSLGDLHALPAGDAQSPDVILIASHPLDETGARELNHLIRRHSAEHACPVVLAIRKVSSQQAELALSHGLGSIVAWSEHSLRELGDALASSRDGHAEMPTPVLLALLRRLHGMRQVTATGDWLSDRDSDVVRLLADGLDTGDIAQQLKFSERTIKSVVANLCSRFSVRNRTHLVAFALRNGIL